VNKSRNAFVERMMAIQSGAYLAPLSGASSTTEVVTEEKRQRLTLTDKSGKRVESNLPMSTKARLRRQKRDISKYNSEVKARELSNEELEYVTENTSAEQLDELSQTKLASYKKAANKDVGDLRDGIESVNRRNANDDKSQAWKKQATRRLANRYRGLLKAGSMKEETAGPIDEAVKKAAGAAKKSSSKSAAPVKKSTPEQRQKARAAHWKKTGVSSGTVKWMKDSGFL